MLAASCLGEPMGKCEFGAEASGREGGQSVLYDVLFHEDIQIARLPQIACPMAERVTAADEKGESRFMENGEAARLESQA